jgi:hypothetical protein
MKIASIPRQPLGFDPPRHTSVMRPFIWFYVDFMVKPAIAPLMGLRGVVATNVGKAANPICRKGGSRSETAVYKQEKCCLTRLER